MTGITITKLPDGGVRYETEKWAVTVYEHGQTVKDGKLTAKGRAIAEQSAARMLAEEVRTA